MFTLRAVIHQVCSVGVSTLFTLRAVIHHCMQCWGFYTVHPLRCYTPLCAVLGFLHCSPSALLYTIVCSVGVSTLFTLRAVICRCMQPLAGALLACNHSGDSGTFQQAACSHPEVHSVSIALRLSEWDSIQLLLFLNVTLFSFDVKVTQQMWWSSLLVCFCRIYFNYVCQLYTSP